MIRFSEYVSLGHPDKIADYISQYLLDRYIEKDPDTRYAVEVQIKDFTVTIGGEVSSNAHFADDVIADYVRDAVNEIGYTSTYDNNLPISPEEWTITGGVTKEFSSAWLHMIDKHVGCLMTILLLNDCARRCSRAASEGLILRRRL